MRDKKYRETAYRMYVSFSLNDKRKLRILFKGFVALPIYKFSEFFQKMFYLSQGLTDVKIVAPRILAIAEMK